MGNRAMYPIIVLLSGALIIELSHEGLPHADYNVPAPTVRVLDGAPVSNVAAHMMTVPADYQTVATQVRLIKG